MNAVPVADPERPARSIDIAGELTTDAPGPGCPYYPRCRYALPICRSEMPVLRPVDGVEVACHRAEELDLRRD